MNTNDRIARMAMWPPVMLAARRMSSANGRTNMPMISIGIRNSVTGSGRPCGTMFFQCFTKPWRAAPAMMMVKKVMVASAAVTLKLPVAVTPPCDTGEKNESSARGCTVWLSSASTSKIGIRPIALAPRDEQEQRHQQRRVGVHPLVADVGPHDRLLDEVDAGFERVHEAGGNRRSWRR
jgi:hypothetical protein